MIRVLAIGIDGADSGLLSQWAQAGDLPTLRRLMEEGAVIPLTTPEAMGDDATWASFSTSSSPGQHGRYFYKRLEPGSYATPMFRGSRLARESFWQQLSEQGRRVAVIDVPKTPLADSINGIQLVDWQVHGPDLPTHSQPPELAEQVLQRFGQDRVDRWHDGHFLCGMSSMPEPLFETFYRRLQDGVRDKTTLVKELLSEEDWDLVLAVYKEAHCVGHQCWHFHDQTHPRFEPELHERYGNPILEIYKQIDTSIGRLLDSADDDTHVLVFSDLGMQSNVTGDHLLDEVLMRLEWGQHTRRAALYERTLHLQEKVRRKLFPSSKRGIQQFRRFYQVDHNEISGAIRINLVGREPAGRVRPGSEYEEVCEQLTQQLLALEEPATGRPAVQRVLRMDESFPGGHRDQLPDLLVEWSREGEISALASPSIGVVRREKPGMRSGNHVSGGVLFAQGPTIAPGRHPEASIMDLGPTIARLLDCQLTEVDGQSISL